MSVPGTVATHPARATAELTVIVVTWNTRELTLRCLETLFENTPNLNMRVIVADNGSEDGSADVIAERFPQVDLIRNEGDFGFARANNEAIERVDSEWVLLLNPDTEVHPRRDQQSAGVFEAASGSRHHRRPDGFSATVP